MNFQQNWILWKIPYRRNASYLSLKHAEQVEEELRFHFKNYIGVSNSETEVNCYFMLEMELVWNTMFKRRSRYEVDCLALRRDFNLKGWHVIITKKWDYWYAVLITCFVTSRNLYHLKHTVRIRNVFRFTRGFRTKIAAVWLNKSVSVK
jgi:hypothetical protein